ncbi:MAG: response regulator transcription factor, partial [Acidimicrobiales bacterium]
MSKPAERTNTVRVVIADDDPDIRVLLRSLLDLDARIEVTGEASDGGEALARFTQLRPDVLVLDERMPILYGLEVAQRVLFEHPDQAVILCT